MAAPSHVDLQTFLTSLRQSGLLSEGQLAAVMQDLPPTHRGRVLARRLVERGWLTKFQAERVLAGRTNGFLLGQYRILDQLGRGGMGQVFKAIHQTMNRVVALKVLAPNLVDTEKARRLFVREMQAAARLMHPNIVTAYDANQAGNRHYLVMEYVDGPNLDRLVRDQGPVPVGQACAFIRQAAFGLQHAFEMGMVHRDIKPANLLVQRPPGGASEQKYTIKILDFGLARLGDVDETVAGGAGTIVTRGNVVMGTPDFVSPEQARNLHAVDIRSDLYSLGCTFYYLLTGQLPYPGISKLEKIIRHSTAEPVAVESLCADLPRGVAAIVRRLMAKDPADRFQTPVELAAALAPFAVADRTPWTVPGPAAAAVSLPPTPPPDDEEVDPDPRPSAAEADEMAALVSTLSPDLSPTPMSTTRFAALIQPFVLARTTLSRRLVLAVAAAVGIVIGLVVVAGALFGW